MLFAVSDAAWYLYWLVFVVVTGVAVRWCSLFATVSCLLFVDCCGRCVMSPSSLLFLLVVVVVFLLCVCVLLVVVRCCCLSFVAVGCSSLLLLFVVARRCL